MLQGRWYPSSAYIHALTKLSCIVVRVALSDTRTLLIRVSSQVVAEERPKAGLLASASCTVVRYYVAKYTVAAAEAWARSNGATEAEIEKARHCLKVQTAQQ